MFVGGPSCTYHVSNCVFLTGTAVTDDKDGLEGEAYFTNCQFVCNGTNHLIYRTHNADERPWYFSNCTFGFRDDAPDGAALVLAVDGTLIFNGCKFESHGETAIAPIIQRAGAIELHSCAIDANQSCWFLSGDLRSDGTRRWVESLRALHLLIEDCVFTGASTSVQLQPYAPLFLRGRGNTFAGSVEVTEQDNNPFPPWPSTDPDLIQSDLQLKRGRATAASGDYAFIDPERDPFGTVVGPTIRDALMLRWNSDWIEIEGAPLPIKDILMYSVVLGAYTGWAINCPVGATIHLYAVDAFRLDPGGNIDTLHVLDPGPGHVLSLRYSAGRRMWVPTDRRS